jgi:hypothetical protein
MSASLELDMNQSRASESVTALKLLVSMYNVPPPTTIHVWNERSIGTKLVSATIAVCNISALPKFKMCAAVDASDAIRLSVDIQK